MKTIPIHASFHSFGPKLMQTTITEEFRIGLLERANKTKEDFRGNLAGHIKKENIFTNEDDRQYFMYHTESYFQAFYDEYFRYMGLKVEAFSLESLWVNWMKNGEFNPPHIHSGDLSFVLYLDVPQEIHNENREYVGTHNGPGSIDFLLELEKDKKYHRGAYTFVPNNGDFFIFPASLPHMVAPFKSDVERVSVAGNIIGKNLVLANHREGYLS